MESQVSPFSSLFFGKMKYLQLEKDDDENPESGHSVISTRDIKTYRGRFIVSSIFNIILFIILLTIIPFHIPSPWHDRYLARATSASSPILNKLPLSYANKPINGSFMDESNPPDIFRSLPSPEADSAWRKVGVPTWIIIDESEVLSLRKDPNMLVRAPEEWGYGKNKFIAMMDLNHQLHCVNQLRMAAFRDEYPVEKNERWEFQREHWMHCVHILYQNIMCAGSTELITYNWLETQRFPVPDFNINKKCKNADALLEFQDREKVLKLNELRDKMVKPDSALALPLPPHLKAFLDAHPDAR